MYISTMHTEHYNWVALGRTKKEAEEAISKKWDEDENREVMTLDELKDYYGIYTRYLEPGECEYE